MKTPVLALLVAAAALSGCETNPTRAESAGPPKAALQFLDLPGFDQTLTGSLGSALPKVDVAFYDRITPSALPVRLQAWLAAVEGGGGKVSVKPPPTVAATRNPMMLLGALSTLWSVSKAAREMSAERQFHAAHGYDAEIVLKLDDKGDNVVDKVVFVQRAR